MRNIGDLAIQPGRRQSSVGSSHEIVGEVGLAGVLLLED